MKTLSLELSKRTTGKAGRKDRTAADLYGVVYGPGLEPMPVSGNYQTVSKLLREAGTSHIIKLTVDESEPLEVLVKELDHEPISNNIRHFDLLALKKGEKINVEVPIELVGESPATKLGNVVHQLIDSLEIHTTPDKIPESFTVDISGLSEVGDTVHVSDLDMDEDIEIEEGWLEQPIVKIDEVRELEVEDTTAEEVSADEVPSERGADEEGEEAEGEEKSADSDSADEADEPESKD